MKIVNWTLLFLATLFCCLDSVKANLLLQDTIRDETYQLYPLGIACRNNDMGTIKRLLAGKDEPMAMGNDCYEFDILYTAIYFNKEDVLKYALTLYKDINDRIYSDEYGLTLLTYACKLSNVKLARILLEYSIHVNGYQTPYDTYKVYPIMEAIANNNIELVQLLLEYHADLNIKDCNGNSPLALAKEVGAKEIEKLLLQYMNNKNNANNAG
ncbi:ankyrin repeat domain-containing protein [Bacteroides fragilis]|jgi:ankyrin repeat protein|nr:ankyrin repeat domain-containing protein [Bacteroides fragilis]